MMVNPDICSLDTKVNILHCKTGEQAMPETDLPGRKGLNNKLNESACGVYIISATPFSDDGCLDLASTDRLVDFYLEKNVSGITILGMMGEAPKLAATESVTFLKHVLNRIDGQIPVVVGVSGPGLDNMHQLARSARDNGAAGVMVAPMSGLNTEEKIYKYFKQVCETLGPDIPVCYQDFPLATGVSISVDLLLRLVRDFEQIVMLKHEDWPGLNKLTSLRQRSEASGARRISILCGNGGLYLPQELARGADGAMTGFAYPEMLVEVVQKFKDGDLDGADDLFEAYLPLVRHEQQPGFGLAIRKEVLRRRGIISSAKTRAPGPSLTPADHIELDRLIARQTNKLSEMQNGS